MPREFKKLRNVDDFCFSHINQSNLETDGKWWQRREKEDFDMMEHHEQRDKSQTLAKRQLCMHQSADERELMASDSHPNLNVVIVDSTAPNFIHTLTDLLALPDAVQKKRTTEGH